MNKHGGKVPTGGLDSGSWKYDNYQDKWIEEPLSGYIDWENWHVRKADQNTTHKFYIDGFYRQATHTLAAVMLDAFPTIAIEYDICHREFAYDNAIDSGVNVIATIRDPFDAVVSAFQYGEYKINETIEFERDINFYIRIYKKLLSIEEKVNFVHFNCIIKNPSNLLSIIKEKYSIKVDNIVKYSTMPETPIYNGTDDRTNYNNIVLALNNFKMNTNLEEAYYLYQKILKSKKVIDEENI